MAKRTFNAGATSQSIDIFVQDTTSSAGEGLSGLLFNSANLKCYYRIGPAGSSTAITLATQTVGGAWSSGGFVEVDATNMKGIYRFDVPNAVLASAPYAILYFYGATNMAPVPVELEIGNTATDYAAIADAVHDEVVEGTTTLRQMMRGFAAALMGKASGLATTTAVYRDIGDTKARITATVDSDGNRSAVTRDLT